MTAEELLSDLEERDVDVSVDGEQLRIDAPHGILTDDLRRTLSERKPELVRLIRHRSPERNEGHRLAEDNAPPIANDVSAHSGPRAQTPRSGNVPTPEEVEAMSLDDFARAGLIVRLGTAESWGSDVLIVSDDVPEDEAREQSLPIFRASELRKIHLLKPEPHVMRLLYDLKTIFGQTVTSVEPRETFR